MLHVTLITLHHSHNYNYSCATPHYIQQLWVRWPTRWQLQSLSLQNRQLKPPFSPSVDSLCHPWFATTKLSYRFPILKLPQPPCAALLVVYQRLPLIMGWCIYIYIDIFIYTYDMKPLYCGWWVVWFMYDVGWILYSICSHNVTTSDGVL